MQGLASPLKVLKRAFKTGCRTIKQRNLNKNNAVSDQKTTEEPLLGSEAKIGKPPPA
jgi:hypothetical protein